MAKQSMIAADARRRAVVERYAARRAALKEQVRRAEPGSAELSEAVRALSRLPRDASLLIATGFSICGASAIVASEVFNKAWSAASVDLPSFHGARFSM